jgi:hypothetical protein
MSRSAFKFAWSISIKIRVLPTPHHLRGNEAPAHAPPTTMSIHRATEPTTSVRNRTKLLGHMLIEKPHELGLTRIDFETLHCDLDLAWCEPLLAARAAHFCAGSRLRACTHPAVLTRIAIARAINGHGCRPGSVSRNQQTSAELICSRRKSPS